MSNQNPRAPDGVGPASQWINEAPRQRTGLLTGLLDPAAIEELDRLALVVDVENPATCVNCGCTDRQACHGRCHWISVNRVDGTGLCSNCLL